KPSWPYQNGKPTSYANAGRTSRGRSCSNSNGSTRHDCQDRGTQRPRLARRSSHRRLQREPRLVAPLSHALSAVMTAATESVMVGHVPRLFEWFEQGTTSRRRAWRILRICHEKSAAAGDCWRWLREDEDPCPSGCASCRHRD